MDKRPQVSLLGVEKEQILKNKGEDALQKAQEKMNRATEAVRADYEEKRPAYEAGDTGEAEKAAEKELVLQAQNKYKSLFDYYQDGVDRLSSDEKIDMIKQIDKYLILILAVNTKEADETRTQFEDLKNKISETL